MIEESVIAELPPVGRYRVRIVEYRGLRSLDIREFIDKEGEFTGFTRKGIRLKPAEVVDLVGSISSDPNCQELLASAETSSDETAASSQSVTT